MASKISTSFNSQLYSYQQSFQVAVLNLDTLIREERIIKHIRKAKVNIQKPQ
jgi:hypothetical protein